MFIPESRVMDGELIEAKPDLEDQIKKLDFAKMIFSLIFFALFAILYWTLSLL